MFQFIITSLSSIRPGEWKTLSEHYKKLLIPYAKFFSKELPAVKFNSLHDRVHVFEKEAVLIRKSFVPDAKTILLTEKGKLYTSEQFATAIDTWSEQHTRPLQFIIGGPLGFDPSLIKEVDASVSLSPMTFPHDFAHILLLEQLYRAMTIIHRKTYHY